MYHTRAHTYTPQEKNETNRKHTKKEAPKEPDEEGDAEDEEEEPLAKKTKGRKTVGGGKGEGSERRVRGGKEGKNDTEKRGKDLVPRAKSGFELFFLETKDVVSWPRLSHSHTHIRSHPCTYFFTHIHVCVCVLVCVCV